MALTVKLKQFHVAKCKGDKLAKLTFRGTIVTGPGDLHYEIEYLGRRFKRHADQIRARERFETDKDRVSRRVRFYVETAEQTTPQVIANQATSTGTPESCRPKEAPVVKTPTLPRRTTRMRRAPSRFSPG